MADIVDTTDGMAPTLEEIQNMKVTDLKKRLKSFGLPLTGNKTELIERLQEASLSVKGLDTFDSSQLSFDESHISELESADDSAVIDDSALLGQHFTEYISSSLDDDSKVLDGAENKLHVISNSASVTMPPKKRTISKAGSEGTVIEKKVSLNRTNVALTDFNIKPVSETKAVTISTDDKNESDEKRVLSVKNMSSAERLAMRAKRFNVSSSAGTTNNSKATNNRNSKQSILASAVTPDLEVLKKRAERFGQSVSTVMKQIEHKEKLLKRKCKFGASLSISATSSLDQQEKKRQRAERFGIS